MTAQLNIKDETTIRLARQMAERSGRTVTAVIRDALEREKEASEAAVQERISKAREMLKGVRKLWKPETENMTVEEIMNSIYDDASPDGFAR